MTHEEPSIGGPQTADAATAVVPALARDRVLYGVPIPDLPPSEIPVPEPIPYLPLPGQYTWTMTQRGIAIRLNALTGQTFTVVQPPPNVDADFAVPIHSLLKTLTNETPGSVATRLAEAFMAEPTGKVGSAEGHPSGFVNFRLDLEQFSIDVLDDVELSGEDYGYQDLGLGRTVVLDVSSPNVAKYMSVGHLRSTVIGESLARIYRAGGFKVIRDNHLGDWGTQFGMLGRARELWGEEIDREMPDADPVQKLYTLYVRINEEVEREKEESKARLRAEDSTLSDRDVKRLATSALEQEGRDWFAKLEQGDPEARALLREATTQSLQEFRRVYELLGSDYEYLLGESFYEGMLPDVIAAFESSGVANRDESGALSITFPPEKHLPRLVLQKSDGTSLYQTREMATFLARTAWFNPDRILYVVGSDQTGYFRQTFEGFRELTNGEGPHLEHVAFGMMSLPEGKMSTRKGNVVFLEDVLTQAIDKARERLLQSSRDLSPEEIETIARQIGVGAVIYMDLKQSRTRDIEFNLNEALSFEGNSAPYIQYAHARAASILTKAQELGYSPDDADFPKLEDPAEKALLIEIAKFPEAIRQAIEANEPSSVAQQVFLIADAFNKFYRDPIIYEKDPNRRDSRLRLTRAAAQVIRNGLYLLGIETPAKM